MMKNKRLFLQSYIVVINCGSSSVKLSIYRFNIDGKEWVLDANWKNIQEKNSTLEIINNTNSKSYVVEKQLTLKQGLDFLFVKIFEQGNFERDSICGIGHRFVHGGMKYSSSVIITPSIAKELGKLADLAPLHNKGCLAGIKYCLETFGKKIPEVAVFDTAFHSSMPCVASHYAIDKKTAHKYHIKRYGFHGISCAYLWEVYQRDHKKKSLKSKVIILHLGNGCSATAVNAGKSIDTSMGFSPLEGLVMGTRSGDIDPTVVEYLCQKEKLNVDEVIHMLNHKSGLLGLSGKTSDMRQPLKLYKKNDAARLAVDMFCYRIVKYIGAYIAALGGVDAIIFSGGIGENSPIIRKKIADHLDWYGIKLNEKANQNAIDLDPGEKKVISEKSKVKVYVIATDENTYIANEVSKLLGE